MELNIKAEEWLPFPVGYRCIFTVDDGVKEFYYAVKLDTLERDSSKILPLIKEAYKERTGASNT